MSSFKVTAPKPLPALEQKTVQKEELSTVRADHVPDLANAGPGTSTGTTLSFQSTMPYAAPPAPRRPFKITT